MSVWDWVREFVDEAMVRGDTQRLELLEVFHEAYDLRETDTNQALTLVAEGRQLARSLGDPRWVLFFDHWRLQFLLHDKADYCDVLSLGVAATLEARKPIYGDFPQRICLHDDLVSAYIGIDPLGHEQAIEQALDFIRQEITPDMECRFCFAKTCMDFELGRQCHEAGISRGLYALELADSESNEHHAAGAYSGLCLAAHRMGDRDSLRLWAEGGEEAARRSTTCKSEIAEFLMWQAYLARCDRDEALAHRLFGSARRRMSRLSIPPGERFHEAWCAYHEQGNELLQALRTRDQELQQLVGRNRLDYECRVRIKRCQLLVQLGQPVDEALREARQAAGRMRVPDRYLAELDKLARLGGNEPAP